MTGSGDLDRRLEDWMRGAASAPYGPGQRDGTVAAAIHRRPLPRWRAVLGSDWTTTPGAATLAPLRAGARPWAIALLLLALLAAGLAGALALGAWPPSPRVPFQLAYGRDGDIWTAQWDGSNAVRIADGSPPDGGPACSSGRAGDVTYGGEGLMWSPDGRHVAFRAETSQCEHTVSISDPDGSHRVTFPGAGWLIAWSPDSTRIATWVDLTPRIESPKFRTIGVYGVDGTRRALLAVDVTNVALEPGDFDVAWAPDGRSLLLPCQRACELPLDGGDVRYLSATDPLAVQDPARRIVVSPDGGSAAISEGPTGTLVVAGLDDSNRRVLGVGGDPVWSPTGDRIAASAATGHAAPPDALVGPSDAVVIDVASGRTTALASGGSSAAWRPIRFSPAGDLVLLARTDVSGTDSTAANSLWSVRTDGTDLRQLVTGTDWGDWQPVSPEAR